MGKKKSTTPGEAHYSLVGGSVPYKIWYYKKEGRVRTNLEKNSILVGIEPRFSAF